MERGGRTGVSGKERERKDRKEELLCHHSYHILVLGAQQVSEELFTNSDKQTHPQTNLRPHPACSSPFEPQGRSWRVIMAATSLVESLKPSLSIVFVYLG